MSSGTGAVRAAAPDPVAYASATGRWILAAAVLGSGMALLDGTVVNVALPAIGKDLGAACRPAVDQSTPTCSRWPSLILLGGSLGDRFGRRRIFVLGVAWFALASLLCGLAQSPAS